MYNACVKIYIYWYVITCQFCLYEKKTFSGAYQLAPHTARYLENDLTNEGVGIFWWVVKVTFVKAHVTLSFSPTTNNAWVHKLWRKSVQYFTWKVTGNNDWNLKLSEVKKPTTSRPNGLGLPSGLPLVHGLCKIPLPFGLTLCNAYTSPTFLR